MLALVGSAAGLCNINMTLEDFSRVESIVLFVVAAARRRRNATENMRSCLLNLLTWKFTPCDMIRLLMKSTTMYVVSEYKLFEENPLCPFQTIDN